MNINVLTLFPEMISQACGHSIVKRAMAAGLISLHCVNIRDFAQNKHGQVDDAPYGGGAGMVMMAPPVYEAYASLAKPGRLVYLTPQGQVFSQSMAAELAQETHLTLLCGHYEGIDQRVIDMLRPQEISIGDYVLTGGELAALVVIDAVARLVPGVLGKEASYQNESFAVGENLLEHPHYTRPPVFKDMAVPDVLLSGHHGKVEAWRREQSLLRTRQRRPNLLE